MQPPFFTRVNIKKYQFLFIVTYRAELALLGAVNEAVAEKIALDIVGLGAEVIAQCLKRVELLVAKQHVDARHQYGRVFR